MTAAAQALHSFYNGAESIIALIFKLMNENLPNDFKWRKTLFEMALKARQVLAPPAGGSCAGKGGAPHGVILPGFGVKAKERCLRRRLTLLR